MRRMTFLEAEKTLIDFVEEAKEAFEDNPNLYSYTDEAVKEGEYMALRWGADMDCILVIELSDTFVPTIYQNCIEKSKKTCCNCGGLGQLGNVICSVCKGTGFLPIEVTRYAN